MRAKSVVHGTSVGQWKLLSSHTTRLTCSTRSRSCTTAPRAVVDQQEPVERRARVHLDPPHATGVGRRVGGARYAEHGRVVEPPHRRVGREPRPRRRGRAAWRRPPAPPALAAVLEYVAPRHRGTGHRRGHGAELPVGTQVDRDRSPDHRKTVPALGEPDDVVAGHAPGHRAPDQPGARVGDPDQGAVPGEVRACGVPGRRGTGDHGVAAAADADHAREPVVTAGHPDRRQRTRPRAGSGPGHRATAWPCPAPSGVGRRGRGDLGEGGDGEGQRDPERGSPVSHGSPPSGRGGRRLRAI